jgi:hypothetical protein
MQEAFRTGRQLWLKCMMVGMFLGQKVHELPIPADLLFTFALYSQSLP